MIVLAVDIGTGTQDILIFDSARAPENSLKLIMPSPTLRLSQEIQQATRSGLPLVIRGTIMGGGPVGWAVEGHRRAGLPVYAVEDAARTFNDDLEVVRGELGVQMVGEEEAAELSRRPGFAEIRFQDFDYHAIHSACAAFGLDLRPDAVALAVFDHGAAPPGVSDRQFRMDYLNDRLTSDPRLSALAFHGQDAPPIMTRLRAVAAAAESAIDAPVVVMDTAPAAILGACQDLVVAAHPDAMIVNIGNFHTLAFQMQGGSLVRLLEHHTGLLTAQSLRGWLRSLAEGAISHDDVFADHGHGALVLAVDPLPLDFVAMVGPRQALLRGCELPVYAAVPHGDQMMAGCYGLLSACADLDPVWFEPIGRALAGNGDRSLW